MSGKPRVAFFDFACCEGCQLTVLSIGEPLIALLDQVDIVTWREAMSEKSDEFDVAVVEGSITRDSDLARLQQIRKRAKTLIALGSCATLGGPHVTANQCHPSELLSLVYGEEAGSFEAGEVRPLSAMVAVDIAIHGCPINPDEFVTVMTHVLQGRFYRPPSEPVCYECKLNQYECVYDRGMMCLGPVTRGGCNAICTSRGHQCFGCRGLIEDPNLTSARDVLQEHGLTVEEVLRKFEIYSLRAAPAEVAAEAESDRQQKGAERWRYKSST